jgi:hypothetical protein
MPGGLADDPQGYLQNLVGLAAATADTEILSLHAAQDFYQHQLHVS